MTWVGRQRYWVYGALLGWLSLAGCARQIPEASCHAIGVSFPPGHSGENAPLTLAIDRFARAQGLQGAVSFPGARSYADGGGRIRIVLHYGVGPLGTLISTYNRPGASDALDKRLDDYLAAKVATRWTVRNCHDIPGYGGGSITQ